MISKTFPIQTILSCEAFVIWFFRNKNLIFKYLQGALRRLSPHFTQMYVSDTKFTGSSRIIQQEPYKWMAFKTTETTNKF